MKKTRKIGQVKAESVKKATKKDWDQWLQLLENNGARNLSHQQTVALLKNKFKLNMWWQQEVARGYQIAIGKRIQGQTLKGLYTLTVTKTMNHSALRVWQFINSAQGLSLWLKPMSEIQIKPGVSFESEGGVYGEIRTLKVRERIRLTWVDQDWPRKTTLQLFIVPRPKNKCLLAVTHEDLATARYKQQMREYWQAVVTEIAKNLG